MLLVDSPRDVGPVRKAMNRTGRLRVDLDVARDPARRLRDALPDARPDAGRATAPPVR